MQMDEFGWFDMSIRKLNLLIFVTISAVVCNSPRVVNCNFQSFPFNFKVAIFVLPVNSALNPFIYTLRSFMEHRHRTHEVMYCSSEIRSKTDTAE